MDRCQCSNPGFCNYFNKEMSLNPPNWQWCQNASPQQRLEHYLSINKGIETQMNLSMPKSQGNLNGNEIFISNEMFINDCINFANLLCKISGVVGIPRSGMIAASIIASILNVPLYSLTNNIVVKLSSYSNNGGYRMQFMKDEISKYPILIVDDTLANGNESERIRNLLIKQNFNNKNFIMSVIYANPNNAHKTDCFYKTLTFPHLLEWNIFNSTIMHNTILDFDGVLCDDIPAIIDNSHVLYSDYINKIKPIKSRLPVLFKAMGICTGRLERYRDITENWLKSHNVNYDMLSMYGGTKEERDSSIDKIIEHKSSFFIKNTEAKLFIESCDYQSRLIAKNTGKSVLCINTKKLY